MPDPISASFHSLKVIGFADILIKKSVTPWVEELSGHKAFCLKFIYQIVKEIKILEGFVQVCGF
jgi:hypothetical protein